MPHAIKMLQDDNNSARILFGQIQAVPAGQADAEDKAAIQLASMLTTHNVLENEFINPMLARLEPALARECEAEHAAANRLLTEIETLDGLERRDVILDLQEVVRAHGETQERSVFPLLTERLGVSELEDLGRSMMTRQQELMHEGADTTGAAETAGQHSIVPRI